MNSEFKPEGHPRPDTDTPTRHLQQRRALLLGALGALALPGLAAARGIETFAAADGKGRTLPPWQPGQLDIHHLAIGRGSATLVILPDGSSLLIDAGATANATDVSVATRPGPQRRAGEWIARYAQRQLRAVGRDALDYALITHLHPDHLGDINPDLPTSRHGDYKLTGISEVAEHIGIGTLLDRGYPDYRYPGAGIEQAPFAANYRAFVQARVWQHGAVARFEAGRADQLRPVGHHRVAGDYGIRNIAVNGEVWTGQGNQIRSTFPPVQGMERADLPEENMCCAAVRIASGPFRYFSGADLTSTTFNGDQPWRNILTAAARAAGPVDVATADHHGLFDAVSADVVRALRPQAWVIPTWHITHPSMETLEHLFNQRLYQGERDVFATEVMDANLLMNRRMIQGLRSTRGHVVVRVDPQGQAFRILVTDNTDEQDRIMLQTGPYAVMPKG